MTLLLALLLTAAGPDPDAAAEWRAQLPANIAAEEPQDDDMRREREASLRREEAKPKFGLGVQVQGRFSFPFGSANRDVATFSAPGGGVSVVFDSNLSWSELFSNGWGTSLTVEVSVVRAGRSSGEYGKSKNNFTMGGYVSFLQSHLTGDTVSDGATSLTAEDLSLEAYLVGATMYQNLGNDVYTEGRFGIGAVHYSEVNGTVRTAFPFAQTFEGTLFKDTWNFAMELRGGVGYRLGPLGVSIGMGFQFLMPPNSGSAIDLDSGFLMTWDIDLGVELGF